MLHIVEDELSACFAADRGVAGREEFKRHRSERTVAGCKARFQRVWTQRIFSKMLHGHPNVAEMVTIISIRCSLRLPLVLFNPALRDLRIDAWCLLPRRKRTFERPTQPAQEIAGPRASPS